MQLGAERSATALAGIQAGAPPVSSGGASGEASPKTKIKTSTRTGPKTHIKTRAILVHINFRSPQYNEEFDEFILLAESAGIVPVLIVNGSRSRPDARYFIGAGTLQELAQQVKDRQIELLLFNHALTPVQERNIERSVGCRALDRVGLILDIFAQRARSHAGKLQVERAQLQHLSTRLVRGWSHLERQKGGIGLRGPGETQLETDRRLLGKRIKAINGRLAKLSGQRQQGRRRRRISRLPQVALVGYTNAGKTSLFNRLSGADCYAADHLFATLDATIRRVVLPDNVAILLSDTVGFIRHIPHDLIESFHATLEEVRTADLLLHVIDINDDGRLRIAEVDKVIAALGAARLPQIMVYNKIDRCKDDACVQEYGHECSQEYKSAQHKGGGRAAESAQLSARVSAKTGAGIGALKQLIAAAVRGDRCKRRLQLPASAGRLRAGLFRHAAVYAEEAIASGGWLMQIEVAPAVLHSLCRDNGVEAQQLECNNGAQ